MNNIKHLSDKELIESLEFFIDLYSISLNSKMEDINSFFDEFVSPFMMIFNEECKKIPYHINIIDELHANENSHSRILVKLLQAKSGDDYYILKSFLKYLQSPFSELANLKVCTITCEKDRIDMRVRWKNYSLIIENKIHNAQEQNEQIVRYINIESTYCERKNIYVLYLGRYGGEEPTEFSFTKEMKNEIGVNYKNIGFFNTILPWLEKEVYPNFKSKGIFLRSAIMQYIDHLNGMFKIRENQKAMKKKFEEFIAKKLNLSSETENASLLKENYERLQEKADEIYEIKNTIDKMAEESKINYYYALWTETIKSRFSNKIPIIDKTHKSEPIFGIELKYKDIRFWCMIGLENRYYFSCRKKENGQKGDSLDNILQELFIYPNSKMVFPDFGNLDYCYTWCDSIEDVFELFEIKTLKIIERIER